MTFMEQLDKAAKDGLNVCDIIIAHEVKSLTPLEGEDFEDVCETAKRAYLKDDGYYAGEIVKTTYYLFRLARKEKTTFWCDPDEIFEFMDEGLAWYDCASAIDIFDTSWNR